jgi:two-component sensor histidine kinase/ActR/RegA family two-component response regulator
MPKVMIAEDDLLMADLLEEYLVECGYEVCGIARTVAEGVALARAHKPDLAVVDVRLANGDIGTDIAAGLDRHDRPGILYATGNVGQIALTGADGEASIVKPYRADDIVRALEIVENIVTSGQALTKAPKGFKILRHSFAIDTEKNSTLGVRRLLRQQAALARFGSFALGEVDLGKVLTEAARVCAQGLNVPFCKVCRYRAEENDLLVEAGVGWHQGVVGRVVSRADESSPQGRAFITAQPVICSDLNKDANFVLPEFYAEHGIVSTVDVIIKSREGTPYGVLEIDSPVQHDYDQHDVDFLTGFANVLAEAVNTSERNIVLHTALDRMTEMLAERDHLLEAKNSALDEKSRLLEEKNVLAQELQHRVRNNLQLIHGMLSRELRSQRDGPGHEGVSAIARRVMTLAQVYDHLLGAELSRTVNFGEYLSSLCSSFVEMEEGKHTDIQLTCQSDLVLLDLDTVTALGLVIAELISNSYLHAFPKKEGTIKVALAANGDKATLSFADNGIGFREHGESKRHGLGLIKRLMQQVDGSAELRSDSGTEWTLTFPVLVTAAA